MYFLKITIFLSVFFLIINCKLTFSKTIFKGGIITNSNSLETKKPKSRSDLNFKLSEFDYTHLDQILNKNEAIRFERRVGIGSPLERVKLHINKTRKNAIDDLINDLKKYEDQINWPDWTKKAIPTGFMRNGLKKLRINCDNQSFLATLKQTWLEKILSSKVPQYERLALFWLNHFSVNFNMYKQKHAFFEHISFIRKNSNKNFIEFLKGSLKDPAMIVYLNNERSYAQNPNENLAREFFELFSLGEGNYTENDIKNFSGFISGNSINFISEKYKFYNYKQSGKTFSAFGKNYKNEIEFFKILLTHPAFGEYIAKKFYNEYVEHEEPSKKDLAFLVTFFKKHNYEIPEMLRGVLYLNKFWEKKLSLVKSPIELFYGTTRTFNSSSNALDHNDLITYMENVGQKLFNPPNIAGWPNGKKWIGGQKLEKRIQYVGEIFNEILTKKPPQTKKNLFKNYVKIKKYNIKLKKFFDKASYDQLAIETILLDYIPKDFATRRYADINVYFYNIQFKGKKYNGIELKFGTDKNNKKSWKELNRFTFYDGYSYPQLIDNWDKNWFSNYRATRGISSSFPIGAKMNRYNQQSEFTKKILLHLLLSMRHVLEKKHLYYTSLSMNNPATEFLTQRVNEVKKILKYDKKKKLTKVFSYPGYSYVSGNDMLFKCGIDRYDLNHFNLYESKILNDYFDDSTLRNSDITLSELLLPDLNLNINNKNFIKILKHEGYQLK